MRQRDEIFLTAAQSAFAIAVFMNLKMGRAEAIGLFVLFATQLFITNEHIRVIYASIYTALCILLLAISWRAVPTTIRDAVSVMRGKPLEEPDGPLHGELEHK